MSAPLAADDDAVTARAPAKVNVHLAVGPLREDGFHELETVFLAVSLFDAVTAAPGDGLSLTVAGEGADGDVPTDRRNLVWQAAELLAEHAGVRADATLAIEKAIPAAAGLARRQRRRRGRARGPRRAVGHPGEQGGPRRAGRRLGSDVPFSLHGGVALGAGRGEVLSPVLARGSFALGARHRAGGAVDAVGLRRARPAAGRGPRAGGGARGRPPRPRGDAQRAGERPRGRRPQRPPGASPLAAAGPAPGATGGGGRRRAGGPRQRLGSDGRGPGQGCARTPSGWRPGSPEPACSGHCGWPPGRCRARGWSERRPVLVDPRTAASQSTNRPAHLASIGRWGGDGGQAGGGGDGEGAVGGEVVQPAGGLVLAAVVGGAVAGEVGRGGGPVGVAGVVVEFAAAGTRRRQPGKRQRRSRARTKRSSSAPGR